MVVFFQSVAGACRTIIGIHLAMTTSLFLTSALVHDGPFEEHWSFSNPTLRQHASYVAFWTPGYFSPVLTNEERKCLDVWMRTLALQTPLFATLELSPKLTLQDSMAVLQGISEIRDGLYLLEKLPISVEPYLQEIRREYQKDVVFLHGKTRTDIALTVPLTSYTIPLFTFPASFTLQLEHTRASGRHLNITTAEHRWFSGRILSHFTNSVSSPWGDIGDLCRRYNGFLWSSMVTKKITLDERRRAFVEETTRREAELKRQQEEQISL